MRLAISAKSLFWVPVKLSVVRLVKFSIGANEAILAAARFRLVSVLIC